MTAVLEFEAREDLDKLLKAAKIFGIYTKQRKINSVLTAQKFVEEERVKLLREKGRKLLKQIREEAAASGLDKMTLDEINAEIAEVRREKSKQKCFA